MQRLLGPPLLALLVLLMPCPACADDTPPPGTALVQVLIPDNEAMARFAATGMPAYASLRGAEGRYLLAGAAETGLVLLHAAGLATQVLDRDMAGARYYIVYPAPASIRVDLTPYGRLLLDDGHQVILRALPADAERLVQDGAEIAAITLVRKPLTPATAASFPGITSPDPLVQAMISQVSQDTVVQYDGDLSGEWPVTVGGAPYTISTRYTYSGAPIAKASQFIGEHLDALGLTVEYQVWHSDAAPNVIGELVGSATPDDIFLIGAHLDDMPASHTYAPGADDNASGCVAALVAADILTQYDWSCTLRFAFWTGEEQGLLGSHAYAQRASQRLEDILGVLNLDMIAWNTPNSSPDMDLHADSDIPATQELAELFADVIDVYDLDLIPQIVIDGTGASDHASFWSYGYPAILGIEDYYGSNDFNPYYHTTGDRLGKLDQAYFSDFVRASLGAMAHMSDCLVTGALQGHVTAAHDGGAIPEATVTITRSVGYAVEDLGDATGYYTTTVPSGTYEATAQAYGYLPSSATGLVVTGDGVLTHDFALQAAAPVPVHVTGVPAGSELQLTWSHMPSNLSYQAHRGDSPYFTPSAQTLLETLTMPFDEPVSYLDADGGLGDVADNSTYVVLGVNAAGQAVASNRVAEFDYALVPGR